MNSSIVVASYNEYSRVIKVLKAIREHTKAPIIVVDDGSNTQSKKILEEQTKDIKNCTLFTHPVNLGKGAAMRTGALLAWDNGADGVIFIDADGQHDPTYLTDFQQQLQNHDLVFGCRELDHRAPGYRRLGNYLVRIVIKHLFHIDRKDLLCGFFAISRQIYPKIIWKSQRYGVETEIATKVGKQRLPFAEVKINTTYIDKYKGVTLFDALKVILRIPQWYYQA